MVWKPMIESIYTDDENKESSRVLGSVRTLTDADDALWTC